MDTSRFDRIARLFTAHRLSRRAAPRAGRAGLVGLLAAVLVLPVAGAGSAQARHATPTAEAGPAWLVVQAFAAATLRPDAAPGAYTLTLADVDATVLAFTDRPHRLVASVPTADFARAVSGEQADPRNATLVAPLVDGTAAMVVVELLSAEHDATARTVTYRVAVLGAEEGTLTAAVTPLAAPEVEHAFGPGHLFVDAIPIPVHMPIDVCGGTVDVDLNPATGDKCVDT